MADVPDIEELLAAWDEDASKADNSNLPVQHAMQTPAMLQSMHTNPFDLLQTGSVNINSGVNDRIQSTNPNGMNEYSFPIPTPTNEREQFNLPSGNSLGSLFLSSVEEDLSSQKTFTPPSVTQQKSTKNKSKKQLIRKADTVVTHSPIHLTPDTSTSNLSQQQLPSKSQSSYSQGQNILQAPYRPPSASRNVEESYLASPSPESFVKPTYHRTQPIPRPQSNTSCDNSFYPGSVPQPSPSGSIDSNFNPRTPLSNNPLTPQSNQSVGSQQNRSAAATPQLQLQHPGVIVDPSYPGMLPHVRTPPPPIVPDDQSHLQYLNTSSSQIQKNMSSEILDDLPTPIKSVFGLHDNYTDFQTQQPVGLQSTTRTSNWMEDPTNQVFTSGMQSNVERTGYTFTQQHNTGINNQGHNFHMTNSSAGLTSTQSQLLDSLTSKKNNKPNNAKSSLPHMFSDISGLQQTSNYQLNLGTDQKQQIQNPKSKTLNLLGQAESGIKQFYSQSSAYEAVSPISDYSNSPLPGFSDSNVTSKATSTASGHHSIGIDESFINISSFLNDSAGKDKDDKKSLGNDNINIVNADETTKFGPLARRRSASAERKANENTKSINKSHGLNLDDDFGFDQDEPTIRLPMKLTSNLEPQNKPLESVPNPLPLQRESYSDQSVYDSVQELAALQQKQKSLMQKLNASRNKPQPQKAFRNVYRPPPSTTTNNTTTVDNTTSNKQTKSRKPAKSNAWTNEPSNLLTGPNVPVTTINSGLPIQSKLPQFSHPLKTQADTHLNLKSMPFHQDNFLAAHKMEKAFQHHTEQASVSFQPVSTTKQSHPIPQVQYTQNNFQQFINNSFTPPVASNAQKNQPNTVTSTTSTYVYRHTPASVLSNKKAASASNTYTGNRDHQVSTTSKTFDQSVPVPVPVSGKLSNPLSIHTLPQSTPLTQLSKLPLSENPDLLSSNNIWGQSNLTHSSLPPVEINKPDVLNWSKLPWASVSSSTQTLTKTLSQDLDEMLSSKSTTIVGGAKENNKSKVNSSSSLNTNFSLKVPHSEPHTDSLFKSVPDHVKLPDMSQIQLDYAGHNAQICSVTDTKTSETLRSTAALSNIGMAGLWNQSSVTHPGFEKNLPYPYFLDQHNFPPSVLHTATTSPSLFHYHSSTPSQSTIPHTTNPPHSLMHGVNSQFYHHPHTSNPPDFSAHHTSKMFEPPSNLLPSTKADAFHSMILPDKEAVKKSLEVLRKTQERINRQPEAAPINIAACTTPATSVEVKAKPPTYEQSVSNQFLPQFTKSIQSTLERIEQKNSPVPVISSANGHEVSTYPNTTTITETFFSKPTVSVNEAPPPNKPLNFSISKNDVPVCLTTSSMPTSVSEATIAAPVAFQLTKSLPAIKTDVVSSAPSTVSILHDKTYHGPKKKHILEKYSQQNIQNSGVSVTSVPSVSTVLKQNIASVTGAEKKPGRKSTKARKPSADKRSTQPEKPTIQTKTIEVAKTSETKPVINDKSSVAEPEIKQATGNLKNVSDSNSLSRDKEQSAGIFSLFDSLLQEASQSASKSLKKPQVTEPEQTKPTISVEKTVSNPSTKSTNTISSVINTITTVASDKSVQKSNIASVQNRSPATFPFKRRHVRNNLNPTTVTPTTQATEVKSQNIKPKVTVATTENIVISNVEEHAKVSSAANSEPVEPKEQTPAVKLDSEDKSTSSNLNLKTQVSGSRLKLRIVAFRSSSGKVIHQASRVGPSFPEEDEDGLQRGKSKKKTKKQKRKKKRRRTSSSSSEDSVKIAPTIVSKPAKKSVNQFPYSSVDELNPPAASCSNNDSEASVGSGKVKKRKKGVGLNKQVLNPPLKRIRTTSSGVASDKDKSKSKQKKSQISTPRYKCKPSQGSTSTTSSAAFGREPGKLPLYLNASVNQSTSAGSNPVPTIQLLPRPVCKPSVKVTSSPSISSTAQGKIVSVKLPIVSPKTPQAQIMPKTSLGGVRYVIKTSQTVSALSTAQRVIIPKATCSSFTVGKAAVLTVCAATTSYQSTVSPSESNSQYRQIVVSPTQPVIMKRFPFALLPKASVTVCTHTSPAKASTLNNSMCNVTFTSPMTKVTSSPLAPKILISPTSSNVPVKSVSDLLIKDISESKYEAKAPGDTCFQAAFSKLISSPNPLEKYVPPLMPSHLLPGLIDLENFRCFECGDTFLFNSSLQHHYSRRSITVKVRCVQCNRMLMFFNKCEILKHAREHSDRGDVMQFNGAHLTPIPLHLCQPRTKEYFLQQAEEREQQKDHGEVFTCTECKFNCSNQAVLDQHFQERAAEWYTCDICRLELHNQCSFSAHMRMHKRVPPHTCPECGQSFDGNGMDFNLHLRIQCFHLSRVSCFKCKLCNVLFLTDDQLRNHLRINHAQVFYKCRECPMAFKTIANISNHQRTAHNQTPEPMNTLKTIYKCPLCDSVFTDCSHSQQLFVLHKHFDSHITSLRITAYKCYLCSNVSERKSSLRDHLRNIHEVSSLTEVANKLDLSNTLDDARQNQDRKQIPDSSKDGEVILKKKSDKKGRKSIMETPNRQTPSLAPPGDEESDSSSSSSDKQPKHARRAFKIRLKGSNESPDVNKAVKAGSVLIRSGKKVFQCGECEKVFLSTHSRSSHVRTVHRGIRALYCCPYCTSVPIKYAKRITLVKHLLKVHDISTPQKEDVKIVRTYIPHKLASSPTTSKIHNNETTTLKDDAVGERRFPRKKITTRCPTKARARRLARMKEEQLGSDESVGEVDERMVEGGEVIHESMEEQDHSDDDKEDDVADIDVSSLRLPTIYTCVKCDYSHEDRILFQEHITEHRSMDATSSGTAAALTMVQCTECGLCFASNASKEKHLFIKHKIKNFKLLERYDARLRLELQNNSSSPSDGGREISATSGMGERIHRCQVCFKKFDADTELRTHMRTHGLAFVKSKQF
nr:mucin-16 [Ciona intestinalis]|eukprot:XP_002122767.2 mucin-16 [Ciona intestinalis]